MQKCVKCRNTVEKELEVPEEDIITGLSIPICFKCLKDATLHALETGSDVIVLDYESQ